MVEGSPQSSVARVRAAGGTITRTPVSFREQKRRRKAKAKGEFTGRVSEDVTTAKQTATTQTTTSSAQLSARPKTKAQQIREQVAFRQEVTTAAQSFATETATTVASSSSQRAKKEKARRIANLEEQQRVARQLGGPVSETRRAELQARSDILAAERFGRDRPIPGTLREAVIEQVPVRQPGQKALPALQPQPTGLSRALGGARAGAKVIGFGAGEPFVVAGTQIEKIGKAIQSRRTPSRRAVKAEVLQPLGQTIKGFGTFFKEKPVTAVTFSAVGGAFEAGFKGATLAGQIVAPAVAKVSPTVAFAGAETAKAVGIGLGAALGTKFFLGEVAAIKAAPEPFTRFGETLGSVAALGVGARAGSAGFARAQSFGIRVQARRFGAKKIPLEQIAEPAVISGKQKFPMTKGKTQAAKISSALGQFGRRDFSLGPGRGQEVFTATTARFGKETRILPGRGKTSPVDPEGLFVAPSVSVRFLRLGKKSPEGPSFPTVLPGVARPTILRLELGKIGRVPPSVRRGATGTLEQRLGVIRQGDVFLANQAGKDVGFITPRLEAGFTGESEVVISAGTKLIRETKEPFTEFTEVIGDPPVLPGFGVLPSGFSFGLRSPLLTTRTAVPIVRTRIEEEVGVRAGPRRDLAEIKSLDAAIGGSSSVGRSSGASVVGVSSAAGINSVIGVSGVSPTTSLKRSLVTGDPISFPRSPISEARLPAPRSAIRIPIREITPRRDPRRGGGGGTSINLVTGGGSFRGFDSRTDLPKEEELFIPGFELGFVGTSKGKRRRRVSRLFKFRPSLVAVEKQIRGKIKRPLTGFEVRPIITGG